MKKVKLALLILLVSSMMMGTLTVAASEQDGIVKGEGSAPSVVPDSVVPSAIEYVEGLNDDKTHDTGYTYAATWFGIPYTPTVSYNLKKVELVAGGGSGNYIVQLRPDSAGWPSNTILRQTSFSMVNTIGWQGAEFSTSYPVTAGVKYWIAIKPVSGSYASLATSGTYIVHVFDDDGYLPWTLSSTGYPWMARFYKEKAAFQYHLKNPGYINVFHINVDASGWINGYMTGGPTGWNPVLGRVVGGRVCMAVDVVPDNSPGYYDMLFHIAKLSTMTGQFIRTYDGMSYDGPYGVSWVWVSGSEEEGGADITEVSGSGAGAGVAPDAWYKFRLNPYIDIINVNTNPGGWLNGYDDLPPVHHPVLGFYEGDRWYFAIDGTDTYYTLVFQAGRFSTMSGDMIRTQDGNAFDGPNSVWISWVSSEAPLEGESALLR